MLVSYMVYFSDGSDKIIEFEKPAGALPDSTSTAEACILVAEKDGKTVDRLAITRLVNGKHKVFDVVTKQYVLERLAMIRCAMFRCMTKSK